MKFMKTFFSGSGSGTTAFPASTRRMSQTMLRPSTRMIDLFGTTKDKSRAAEEAVFSIEKKGLGKIVRAVQLGAQSRGRRTGDPR